ncbi:uncharacterized protein LOC135480842 [Liolophura sinensis]|uniref:uncharacterized protein LOC135480842 n=1 Tax=Liolophura sinensis TaxID=3198878 RepID=UPI00315957D2
MDNIAFRKRTCDPVVSALCEEFWEWRLSDSPEFASFCGEHKYDDRFDDVSEQNYISKKKSVEGFLARVKEIDPSPLNEESRLDLLLLKEELKTYLEGFPAKGYLFPINYMEGIHVDSYDIISYMKFEEKDDYEKYLKRLQDFPRRCKDVQTVLEKAVQSGITNHSVTMKGVIEQFESLKTDSEDVSRFLAPFKTRPSNVDEKTFQKFKEETKKVMTAKVIPASEKLKSYIQDVYMKHLRPNIGISTLPGGAEFYQKCLNFHLTQQMEPQDIHQIGLQEVERIKAAMATLIEAEGFDSKNFAEFLKNLQSRKEFFCNTPTELLDYIKHICYDKIRPELPRLFRDIPDSKMSILETPSFLTNSPVGFYKSGTYDGSRAGVYYMNTSKLKASPKYSLMALSLHEGEPGHHFQAVNTFAQEGLPGFRLYLEDMKYYSAPTRFSLNTANIEGWGLYSEALGEELGLYEDNFSMIGRYSFEIHRASRLVVDTGMHCMGWSREEAVKYMSANSALDEWFISNEIDRYITWPGQACAYKIGEMKIWDLRKKAEKELGDLFDIKDFHAWILKAGPVPLYIMDRLNDSFIQQTKQTC